MEMTRFCQSRNLFIKGEVAIQKKPKVASMGYRNKRGSVVNRKRWILELGKLSWQANDEEFGFRRIEREQIC